MRARGVVVGAAVLLAVVAVLGVVFRDRLFSDEVVRAERAVRATPVRAAAHERLGRALLDAGRSDDAEASFRRALELDPSSVEAHAGLGAVLARQRRWDDAIREYGEAIRLDPDNAEARLQQGLIAWSQGDRATAVRQYQALLRLDPKRAAQLGGFIGAAD